MHHWQVARHFQRQFVAVFALGFCQLARCYHHVLWDACQFRFGGVVCKRVSGIECVFTELLAQLSLALLNFRKALLGCTHQLSARQHKIAHGVFVRLLLFSVQGADVDGFVFGIQRLICTQPGVKLCNDGQSRVVGGAQLGRVSYCVQVTHSAPGAAQLFRGNIQYR